MTYYDDQTISKLKKVILDSLHDAYSHLSDQKDVDEASRNFLIECYEKELKKRFFLLSYSEFLLTKLYKTKKIEKEDYKQMYKEIKIWIMSGWEPGSTGISNNVDNIETVLENSLNKKGIQIEDIDITEKDILEITTNSNTKFQYWRESKKISGKSLKRKSKDSKPPIQSMTRFLLPEDKPKDVVSFSDFSRVTTGAVITGGSKEIRKTDKFITQNAKNAVREKDHDVFEKLFKLLNENDKSVKQKVIDLWDEILGNSKKGKKEFSKKGNIRNKELYQLYIIKLVNPSYQYIDLYNAYRKINPDVLPETIYNHKIQIPGNLIKTFMSNFFNNPPKKLLKLNPVLLDDYRKRNKENNKPKYNFEKLFNYIDNESYTINTEFPSPIASKYEAKERIYEWLDKNKDNMSDSPHTVATELAKLITGKKHNNIVNFRIINENGEISFSKVDLKLVESIILS